MCNDKLDIFQTLNSAITFAYVYIWFPSRDFRKKIYFYQHLISFVLTVSFQQFRFSSFVLTVSFQQFRFNSFVSTDMKMSSYVYEGIIRKGSLKTYFYKYKIDLTPEVKVIKKTILVIYPLLINKLVLVELYTTFPGI